jgi:hypothetical protein
MHEQRWLATDASGLRSSPPRPSNGFLAPLRRRVAFRFEKGSSIGETSGEYAGKKSTWQPHASLRSRTPRPL